jgi:hypothetical protein
MAEIKHCWKNGGDFEQIKFRIGHHRSCCESKTATEAQPAPKIS